MRFATDEVIHWLPFAMCVLVRVSAMLASLPAPLGSGSPVQTRAALGVVIALALSMSAIGGPQTMPFDPVVIAAAAVGELAIGAAIGITARVTLAAAEIAGNAAGLSMGHGFAGSIDPTFGEEALPTGRLTSALGVLLFFAMHGHHIVLRALGESVVLAPPGHALEAVMHDGIFEVGSTLVSQGLRIASPLVAAMLLVQVGLALVARAAPRVQLFALSFAVTSTVGAIVLFAAIPSMGAAIAQSIGELPAALSRLLGEAAAP